MRDAIGFVASAGCGVETAANRRGSDTNSAPPANAMAEREFRAEAPARIAVDPKVALAVGEKRFKLRITFKAFGHVGHDHAR